MECSLPFVLHIESWTLFRGPQFPDSITPMGVNQSRRGLAKVKFQVLIIGKPP